MSNTNRDVDKYIIKPKEGAYIADSKGSPGVLRALWFSDKDNSLMGPAELIKVEEDDDDEYNFDHNPITPSSEPTNGTTRGDVLGFGIFIAGLMGLAVAIRAAPHISKAWNEKALPIINNKWPGLKKYVKRLDPGLPKNDHIDILSIDPINESHIDSINIMTNEEAQREVIDIFILYINIAVKIKNLSRSVIVDNDDRELINGNDIIARFKSPTFTADINKILQRNSALLEESSPEISLILDRPLIINGQYIPIKNDELVDIINEGDEDC
jgi:hypothetical protein